jgi:hypothetical protein
MSRLGFRKGELKQISPLQVEEMFLRNLKISSRQAKIQIHSFSSIYNFPNNLDLRVHTRSEGRESKYVYCAHFRQSMRCHSMFRHNVFYISPSPIAEFPFCTLNGCDES